MSTTYSPSPWPAVDYVTSLCDSPVVLTFANSNPTLSYTSRLEHRIKELEAQLAAAKAHGHGPSEPSRTSSPSIGPSAGQSPMTDSHHFESQDEESVSESFKGLKVDDKGAITYHGSTSFFQLPGDRPSGARDQQSTSNQAMQRRERLVANAWQQRALENMSDIPVRTAVFVAPHEWDCLTDISPLWPRNHSNTC